MSDVKWIKLSVDMFDNRKIKYLRHLPEGNNIVLIWVALLTMAGRCNAGGMIFLTENIPYTTKMLADELDFDETVVTIALSALENLGMINTSCGGIAIASWSDHQSMGVLEQRREANRQRQQAWRDRQKALSESSDVTHNVTNNTDVTQNNEPEEEKEIDKEIDKEDIHSAVPYGEIIEYLNSQAGTHYRSGSKATRSHINARFDEGFSLEDFKTVIDKKVQEWKGTDMERYLRPDTLFGTKFESYLNQSISNRPQAKTSGFVNYTGRNTDYDELIRKGLV